MTGNALERFNNIDFVKFLLALQIAMHHEVTKWVGLENFKSLIPSHFYFWSIAVEAFFIVSGFFLFKNMQKDTPTFQFAIKKFFRLAPCVWLVVIISAIFNGFIHDWDFSFAGNILTITLTNGIGFSGSTTTGGMVNGALWFISVLFWCSLFYFYINKIFDKKYLNLIIWLIIIISYSTILHFNHFKTSAISDTVFYFFNMGVLRGLGGIGIGYFLCMMYKSGFLQNCTKKISFLISLIELGLIAFFVHYMFFAQKLPGGTAFVYIICISAFLYLMLVKQGIISKFLNNPLSALPGKYSYSIYIIHPIIIYYLTLTFSNKHMTFVNKHLLLYFSIQTIIIIIAGVLTYHLFEKPVNKLIKNTTK